MWGVTRKRTVLQNKNSMIIMSRLFANIPGTSCMTLLPIYLIFLSQYNIPAVFFIRALHMLNNQTDRHSVCVCVFMLVCVKGYSETFMSYFFFLTLIKWEIC